MQTTTTPTISIDPVQPTITPEIPLDPNNPLIWLLVISTLLTAIDEPLNAIANLITAIRPFIRKRQNRK